MEIILKILTLIMFIGILYNSRQRKRSMMNGMKRKIKPYMIWARFWHVTEHKLSL